jgi:hypothetical protein
MSRRFHLGWIVVERYRVTIREPVLPLTHETIRKQYRGFDGVLWPTDVESLDLVDGLLPFENFDDAKNYQLNQCAGAADLVLIADAADSQHAQNSLIGAQFLGYDYGYFVSEDSHFSSLLNEVMYGVHDEMRSFAAHLNNALLLGSLARAAELHRTRVALKSRGCHLEGEPAEGHFAPIAIFTPSTDEARVT